MKMIISGVFLVCSIGLIVGWFGGHEKQLYEKAFHAEQEKLIEAHKGLLVKAGRISDADHFGANYYLGKYGWYSGICDEDYQTKPYGACSFGAYTFSEEAFEQARQIYVIPGQIEAASNLLIDVGIGAFTKDIIGYTVGSLTYCELTGGKLRHCGSENFGPSTVTAFIDKNTVRLDRKAKWNANMYGLAIVPPGYVNQCGCTSGATSFQGPERTPTQD